MFKGETTASVRKVREVREALHLAHEHLAADPRFRTLTLYCDVDPCDEKIIDSERGNR